MSGADDAARSPAAVWQRMLRGNERFARGEPEHPRQDVERRSDLASGQRPEAALLGCSDSRVSAELLFDQGLGDLFVVRNAGQVVSSSVIGSLEFAVAMLGVPLIVVLSHDRCGAVNAAIAARRTDAAPLPHHIGGIVSRITPAVDRAGRGRAADAELDAAEVGREHLHETVHRLLDGSELISEAVAAGTLAVVGATYRLLEGRAVPDLLIGDL